jgi:hypothetical protein
LVTLDVDGVGAVRRHDDVEVEVEVDGGGLRSRRQRYVDRAAKYEGRSATRSNDLRAVGTESATSRLSADNDGRTTGNTGHGRRVRLRAAITALIDRKNELRVSRHQRCTSHRSFQPGKNGLQSHHNQSCRSQRHITINGSIQYESVQERPQKKTER